MDVDKTINTINSILNRYGMGGKVKVFSETDYIEAGDWVIYVNQYALHETTLQQETILETIDVPGFGIDQALYVPGSWLEPESVDIDENIFTTTSIYTVITEIISLVIRDDLDHSLEYYLETNNETLI